MRYEKSPIFSLTSFSVPELQHFEVGIFRGRHVFVAAIFTTPVPINLSLNLIELSNSSETVHTKVNEDAGFRYAISLLLHGH